MAKVVGHLTVFLAWNIVVGAFLLLGEPWLGLPVALVLAAALLWGYLLRPPGGGSEPRRWATLRLRPLTGPVLIWTLAGIPTLLILGWSMGDVYTRLVPVPPETLDPFRVIMQDWTGRLVITVFAVAIAPIAEELVFRGLIQREIERKYGPVVGISTAAALFAGVHFLPWVFPLHFLLGVTFGFAVYATRSIWAGVLLHAANNGVAVAGAALTRGSPETTGSIWEIGLTADLWISLCSLLLALVLSVWVGRHMLAAGRPRRLRAF